VEHVASFEEDKQLDMYCTFPDAAARISCSTSSPDKADEEQQQFMGILLEN
jgi:hypothetical protein